MGTAVGTAMGIAVGTAADTKLTTGVVISEVWLPCQHGTAALLMTQPRSGVTNTAGRRHHEDKSGDATNAL